MNNVGIVWHYGEYHNLSPVMEKKEQDEARLNYQVNDVRHEDYPLLGRRVELMMVAAQIMLLDAPVTSEDHRRDLAAIIFEGRQSAKSDLLVKFLSRFRRGQDRSKSPTEFHRHLFGQFQLPKRYVDHLALRPRVHVG